MKVWVLEEIIPYEGSTIIAIFSREDLAIAACKSMPEDSYVTHEVTAHELDDLAERK